MKGIEFVIYWVVAMFCYDILKKLFKKMTDKYFWVHLYNTPNRLWRDYKVKKDFATRTEDKTCCANCCRRYRSHIVDENGCLKNSEPECERFQNWRKAKWMNEFKERDCKNFKKLPKPY